LNESLPDIPLIDLRSRSTPHMVEACPALIDDILETATRHYTRPGIQIADVISRHWLARCNTPYKYEIAEIARRVARPGATMLNLSFEWACTTSASEDPVAGGMRLLRTLDWPLASLGRTLVAVIMTGRMGDYVSITWPGFAGVLTAVAKGRFAVAINQPPLVPTGFGRSADWMATRGRVWMRNALPPAHLLRQVMEDCASFDEAKEMLARTPIALPVFYTLAGLQPGQGCVIERKPDSARLREGMVTAANHWVDFNHPGDRGRRSEDRLAAMTEMTGVTQPFEWLVAPVLNPDTRLAFEANTTTGAFRVQGWESDGAATSVLEGVAP
tara:strand:+ start:5632 stop:6615 length:984 start_codon:yes stop_codon:yes gene_type:complete